MYLPVQLTHPHLSLFGGPRILSLFDPLAASPTLHAFTWSPLVQSAITRNFALLQPHPTTNTLSTSNPPILPSLLAVHLRRGDYVRHCPNLAKWGADYMGINQHPSLVDRFDPRPLRDDPVAKEAYYLEHCLPTTTQLVARLHEIRIQHPGLRRLYVLSNEWAWALAEVRDALQKDGWEDVVSTADVKLDAEQYYVSMAVDMAIAERAEVFVGNGVRPLSFSTSTLALTMLVLVFESIVQRGHVATSQRDGPIEQSVLVEHSTHGIGRSSLATRTLYIYPMSLLVCI